MRRLLLLAGLLTFVGATNAWGQPFGLVTCIATATPAQVKAQGTVEALGDIILSCITTNSPQFAPPSPFSVTVSVALNATIPTGAHAASGPPILSFNENACDSPAAVGGTYSSCGAADARVQDPQFGVQTAANAFRWTSAEMPVPGACPAGDCLPEVTSIRISGLRALVVDPQITAFVSVIGPMAISINNNTLNVGERAVSMTAPYSNATPDEVGTVTCTATANPAVVDPTGADEQVGPILLGCFVQPPTGGATSTAPLQFDLSVRGNVDFAGPTSPGPGGTTLAAATLTLDGDAANAYVAELEAPDEIRFRGVSVPLDAGRFQIAIENMFSDVSQLGIPNTATYPSTQVTAFVSVGGGQLAVTNNVLNIGAPIGPSPAATSDLPIPLGCTATAVPPVNRAEGIAEIQGDIVLVCYLPAAPSDYPASLKADISVALSVNVTNNIGFSDTDLTDAVLVVNENNCLTPASAGSVHGGCGAAHLSFQDPQLGRLVAANRLEWKDVEIPVPRVDPDEGGPLDPNPQVVTIRITGIRAFSGAFGIPSASTFPSTQVTAFIGIGNTSSLTVNNNVLNIGVPILGLIDSIETAPTHGRSCVAGSGAATLRLAEGFATAFKTQGVPTFDAGRTQVETGYHAPGSNNGGGASQPTRVLLRFEGVPRGVTVTVPKHVETGDPNRTGDSAEFRLLEGTDERGAAGVLSSGEGLQTVSFDNGSGFAVYELLDGDPFRMETLDLPIEVSWPGKSGGLLTRAGQATVRAMLAPLSAVTTASGPEPEPRFRDPGGPGEVFLSLDGADCFANAFLGAFTDGAWFRDRNGDFAFDPATEIAGWGSPGDTPVVGDWNGDGFRDLGVFSGGTWFLDINGDSAFDPSTDIKGWGEAGWIPVTGDWNGDGVTDIGAVDPISMAWFRDMNGDFAFDPATEIQGWGSPGNIPVVGDWNGDGADEIGVFADGAWFLDRNGDGAFDPATEIIGWGAPGWTPVAGDWDGDGDDDIAAIDPATMAWFRDVNGDFAFDPATEILGWGSPGNVPVVGDWDGNGSDNVGVFDGGMWFIDSNGDGGFDPSTDIRGWGAAGWMPVAGPW